MTTLKKGSRGEEVKALQRKLSVAADGIFGIVTEEAVKAFQKAHGLTVDGIVGAKTWAALGVTTVNPRTIRKIIVHCTATPEGEDFTVEQLRAMHTLPKSKGGKGWSDIGYHWVVYRDGSVHAGRSEKIAGAHAEGHNYDSIGVVYIGGCEPRSNPKWQNTAKDTRTPLQKAGLLNILHELLERYPGAQIYGHRDFTSAKACPSFDAKGEYGKLKISN